VSAANIAAVHKPSLQLMSSFWGRVSPLQRGLLSAYTISWGDFRIGPLGSPCRLDRQIHRPSGPIHGIDRRTAASRSRARMKAFSFASISRRPASHISGETIGGVIIDVISYSNPLSLHEAFGEDLPRSQVGGPDTPRSAAR
jgi:hypothetical protein